MEWVQCWTATWAWLCRDWWPALQSSLSRLASSHWFESTRIRYSSYAVDCDSGEEVRGGCHVEVLEGQVLHVRQRDRQVVHPDPPLALRCREQQRRLQVQVRRVPPCCSVRVLVQHIRLLDLIHVHSLTVDRWTYYEILCLVFDLDISVTRELNKPHARSDSKHSLPRHLSRQRMIKFVGKFETLHTSVEFRVVIERTRGLFGELSKGRQVLKLVLTMRENE